MCIVTLAGCGTTKKNPQYIAELRFPYVSPTNHKELEISYRFQNTDVRVGKFPSIGFLVLTVYDEDNNMLGYEIVDAYDKCELPHLIHCSDVASLRCTLVL